MGVSGYITLPELKRECGEDVVRKWLTHVESHEVYETRENGQPAWLRGEFESFVWTNKLNVGTANRIGWDLIRNRKENIERKAVEPEAEVPDRTQPVHERSTPLWGSLHTSKFQWHVEMVSNLGVQKNVNAVTRGIYNLLTTKGVQGVKGVPLSGFSTARGNVLLDVSWDATNMRVLIACTDGSVYGWKAEDLIKVLDEIGVPKREYEALLCTKEESVPGWVKEPELWKALHSEKVKTEIGERFALAVPYNIDLVATGIYRIMTTPDHRGFAKAHMQHCNGDAQTLLDMEWDSNLRAIRVSYRGVSLRWQASDLLKLLKSLGVPESKCLLLSWYENGRPVTGTP